MRHWRTLEKWACVLRCSVSTLFSIPSVCIRQKFKLVLEIIITKKSLWTSELWLQDADKYGKLVLNADPIKLYHYVLVDISVQSYSCQVFVCLLACF